MLQVGHPCGLCNRVDVIVTGYLLARMQGEDDIEIFWPLSDQHMPVSFHRLFTRLPRGRVVEREIHPRLSRDYIAAQASLPPDYRESKFYGEMLSQLLANVVPEVQSSVSAFAGQHFQSTSGADEMTVGMHIRRAEKPFPVCPYAQPLRYYEAIIRSFPDNRRFFISTDSQEAFRWMHARFGDRVFQRPKVHDNRSDIAGVREGLVDLLLLSRCQAVVGTFGSSFSYIAARAGGRPILMVKAYPRVPVGWPGFSVRRWLWAYRHFLVESTVWRRWFDWVVRPQAARVPRIPARCLRIARAYARR
jgi:hypothetical protein